ncbi:YecA family protein [Endozoicomonas sp. GU-1]|uniref:YecA/YgfB family protein n=1 Tax=Endozoicomonas sp. GU-1 TaxID=3009078 RepID=UPI0022B3066D|nr:YecA family protein [Endozoicomonas sp. GU-1]WBA80318.1 YecA family protein [Endozoicomonas sp. GU-1]
MSNTRASVEALLQPFTQQNEGTLDYHGLHGFLTALTICPIDLTEQVRNESIFDGEVELPAASANELNELIARMQTTIDRGFNDEDEGFSLSCESDELEDHDDEALANWCIGFMVAHFLDEDVWFGTNEQEVCELLLPIMLASACLMMNRSFRIFAGTVSSQKICAARFPKC